MTRSEILGTLKGKNDKARNHSHYTRRLRTFTGKNVSKLAQSDKADYNPYLST